MEKRIGVIHYNFSFTFLEDFLGWCKEKGCEYVEIQRSDIWIKNEEPEKTTEKVAKLLKKYGLKVSQVSAGNDFIQKTKEEFNNQVNIVEKVSKLVKILDANQLRIDGGWPKEGVEENKFKELIIEGIKKTLEFAEKENVYFALDNHGQVTNDYILQLEIFEKMKSKKLGANLDTMNYRWYGWPVKKLVEIYRLIAPYTLHTHIKDGIGVRSEYKGKVFGEGEIPLIEVIKILKSNNYKGVWCIEYEGNDKEIGYEKCINWLKENL